MTISPYVRALRAKIGSDLLLLPSVAVLPWDAAGHLLLVRQADSGAWTTIGGAIEPDEAPEDAARREALEEAGVAVELRSLRAVVGGPGYRVRYPNGDESAYVAVVYDAVVTSGAPAPDGRETTEVRWFAPDELGSISLNELNRRLLTTVLAGGG